MISGRRLYLGVKRALDMLGAGTVIVIASPVLVGVAAAIKATSPGPVLFKQRRIGQYGEIFEIWKFRTMYIDTPADTPTHLLTGAKSHITPIGGVLRRTSLDELPQLVNIFRGQMSFVGPRPALWNQTDLYNERERYGANHVPQGLTGWAQINGRDELEIAEKARLDGEYARRIGPLFDLRCLVGTVSSALGAKGVREGSH